MYWNVELIEIGFLFYTLKGISYVWLKKRRVCEKLLVSVDQEPKMVRLLLFYNTYFVITLSYNR